MLKLDLATKASAFSTHWQQAETALGRAIVLPDGTTRAAFDALAKGAGAAQTTLTVRGNDLEGAQQTRDGLIDDLQSDAVLFADLVRVQTPGSDFARMLPRLPTSSAAGVKWAKVLEDLDDIWERLDAARPGAYPAVTLPVTLSNGTRRSGFGPRVASYKAALATVGSAGTDIKQAQATLRTLRTDIDRHVAAYRKLLRTLFPAGHPLRASLP